MDEGQSVQQGATGFSLNKPLIKRYSVINALQNFINTLWQFIVNYVC